MNPDRKKLEDRITELEQKIERMERQSIIVVGKYDGTNVPVMVQGIRRKIATSAP